MPSIRAKSVSGRARGDLATAPWPPAGADRVHSRGVDARLETITPADITQVSSKIRAGAFNNFWRNIVLIGTRQPESVQSLMTEPDNRSTFQFRHRRVQLRVLSGPHCAVPPARTGRWREPSTCSRDSTGAERTPRRPSNRLPRRVCRRPTRLRVLAFVCLVYFVVNSIASFRIGSVRHNCPTKTAVCFGDNP